MRAIYPDGYTDDGHPYFRRETLIQALERAIAAEDAVETIFGIPKGDPRITLGVVRDALRKEPLP